MKNNVKKKKHGSEMIRRLAGLFLAAAVTVTSPGGLSVSAAGPAVVQPAADQAAGGQSDAAGNQSEPGQPDRPGNAGSQPKADAAGANESQAGTGQNGSAGADQSSPDTAGGNESQPGTETNGSQSGGSADQTNGSPSDAAGGNGSQSGGSTDQTNGSQSQSPSDAAGGNGSQPGGSTDQPNGSQSNNPSDAAGGNGSQSGGSTDQTNGGQDKNQSGADGENGATGGSGDQQQSSKVVEGEVIIDKNNDKVEIGKNDKPYLALGADLTEEQRKTVLGIMGIDPAALGNYDVVYVTNQEEHQYLDSYISSSQIGSRSLSSVLIIERKKGSGLNISTNNITYCTVGMYKNALVTAGITDADIIVAGPTGISGTAALVGVFKAYQEMTGQVIDAEVIDVALHELVVTGELEASIEGLTDEEVEEFIAYIKSVIAENDLSDEASINRVIDEACEKYGVVLSDSERQQIVDLLLKLTSLGIDLDGLVDYAHSLYNSYKNGGGSGILWSIGNFFSDLFTAIGDFFKGLFS